MASQIRHKGERLFAEPSPQFGGRVLLKIVKQSFIIPSWIKASTCVAIAILALDYVTLEAPWSLT